MRFSTADPSPQSMVPDSESSHPGSRRVPETVTGVFSATAAGSLTSIAGATFVTVTTAVSSAVRPLVSVTQTFTVVVPSSPTLVKVGLSVPEESSQTPSPLRSQL